MNSEKNGDLNIKSSLWKDLVQSEIHGVLQFSNKVGNSVLKASFVI
jgi:hypothetical protein